MLRLFCRVENIPITSSASMLWDLAERVSRVSFSVMSDLNFVFNSPRTCSSSLAVSVAKSCNSHLQPATCGSSTAQISQHGVVLLVIFAAYLKQHVSPVSEILGYEPRGNFSESRNGLKPRGSPLPSLHLIHLQYNVCREAVIAEQLPFLWCPTGVGGNVSHKSRHSSSYFVETFQRPFCESTRLYAGPWLTNSKQVRTRSLLLWLVLETVMSNKMPGWHSRMSLSNCLSDCSLSCWRVSLPISHHRISKSKEITNLQSTCGTSSNVCHRKEPFSPFCRNWIRATPWDKTSITVPSK